MEHLGLTTASTTSYNSRKLVVHSCTSTSCLHQLTNMSPRCDCSSTFSIIFPVQVAVWGYWKCSSSEFSVDRFHHSHSFSFGGPHIPTRFLGGWNRLNIPSMVWSTQGYPFLSGAWNWIPTSWMGLHRHRTSEPWQETLKPPNGKKRWGQSMANHLAKHFLGVSS